MLKGIVNGTEKDIIRIPMLVNGTYKEGWEVRDNQDRLIWGYNSTISGVTPISFKGGGIPLTAWSIAGNMVQTGTPAPEECGELVTSGEHAGQYAIPITLGGTTQTIYLSEPLRKALDGSNAVDTLSSDGTLTREVDSEGNSLVQQTTETVSVPTLIPAKGSNTLTVDTELQPSSVSITGHIKSTA